MSCQSIYIDTSFNSLHTVLLNLYRSLIFAAMRFHVYLRDLTQSHSTLQSGSFKLIQDLANLIFVFVKSRRKPHNSVECAVTKAQMTWLVMHAFHRVLSQRPAGYEDVLPMLRQSLQHNHALRARDLKVLHKVVRRENIECFEDFIY